jgi:cytochrome c-type biogenesis protein CcsB
MDAAQLGEWSRLLVSGSLMAFLVAWLAFGADQVARRRQPVRELAGIAAGGSGRAGDVPEGERAPGEARPGLDAAKAANIGWSVSILATALLAAGVLTRALAVERAPWANMHEFSITATLVAAGVFLGVGRTRVGRELAMWVVLLFVLTLTMAVTILYVAPGPLVPALDSYWLVIHVGMAVTAFALFTIAAVVSGLQIAAARGEKLGRSSNLPAATSLDRLAYRLIAVAFPIWTIGPLILGAIWAEVSWGRYWGWDPKEVWALITWLAYAAYLHARATAGWSGIRASVVSLIGFATLLFSYFAVNIVFNGLHSYGGL